MRTIRHVSLGISWSVGLATALAVAGCGARSAPPEKAPTPASAPAASSADRSKPAEPPGAAVPPRPRTAEEIATVTDEGGVSTNLRTFHVDLESGQGDLMHQSGIGYEKMHSIPLREGNGVVRAMPIDRIASLGRDGAKVAIMLTSGGRLSGTLLAECVFAGESGVGTASIPAGKTHRIEFDPEKTHRFLVKEKETPQTSDFLGGDEGVPATVSLRSGESLELTNMSLVYRYSGCSSSYIPCKPFMSWGRSRRLGLVRGSTSTEIGLSGLKALDLRPGEPLKIVVSPRNAEPLEGTLGLGEGVFRYAAGFSDSISEEDTLEELVGVVGTSALGNVHVPTTSIASIAFAPGSAPKKK